VLVIGSGYRCDLPFFLSRPRCFRWVGFGLGTMSRYTSLNCASKIFEASISILFLEMSVISHSFQGDGPRVSMTICEKCLPDDAKVLV